MRVAPGSAELTVALLTRLAPRSALLVGAVPEPILTGVRRLTSEVEQLEECTPVTAQLDRRFDLVLLSGEARSELGQWRSVLHCSVQLLEPGGHLVVLRGLPEQVSFAEMAAAGLFSVEQHADDVEGLALFRRSERFNVHDLLFEARSTISRVTPPVLLEQMRSGDPPLVLDTRTHTDRGRFGVIEGSVHVPRTVVEWHLDPANHYPHPAVRGFDHYVVVVCNAGYSSSLAAANLVRLGFRRVADLVGGINGWIASGLPLHTPDHSHLDF